MSIFATYCIIKIFMKMKRNPFVIFIILFERKRKKTYPADFSRTSRKLPWHLLGFRTHCALLISKIKIQSHLYHS